MSEPRSSSSRAAETPPALAFSDAADLFAANGPTSDDSPTIISKGRPQAARVENALAGTLRGRTLAHFELIEPIGVGGMAAVIRARDMQLDRNVALKILPPEMALDPENIRRFHQEARAAARLDHENIARVFFCGDDQRLHFIAFEFVEGDNLRVVLERRGRLPVPESIHYMLQVATGLAHAAARGVVHRDIKPSNIIISPNGRAKLVDMGLARSLEPHRDNGLTQSGVTLGTFDYISPEQALEPRDADVRSDIYSLGCTFYHMLTGNPPIPDGTAAKKLHHHQHVAPIDPRQINPQIPDDVAAILARMMAKDPKDRYQRAEHLVQHLIMSAQKLGAVAENPDGVLFVDAPLPSAPRKRPALIAALAVMALTALIAVLSLAPTDAARTPPVDDVPGRKDRAPRVDADTIKNPVKAPDAPVDGKRVVLVRDVAGLTAALAAKQNVKRIILEKDLALTPDDNGAGETAGLIYRGKPGQRLTIESKDPKKPCTIRVEYPPRMDDLISWTGISFDGGSVKLSNVRIEIKGKPPAMAESGLAAFALAGGELELDRCTFIQADYTSPTLAKPDRSVAMVSLIGSTRRSARLLLKECYFSQGQTAVAINAQTDSTPSQQLAAEVVANDCAFGPHAALFHVQADCTKNNAKISLKQCSAFVVDGPVFRLEGNAGCSLDVQHSIFSRPFGGSDSGLIRQTDSSNFSKIHYKGKRNCYHNLNAFWTPSTDATEPALFQWADFKIALEKIRSQDLNPAVLADVNPWQADNPLALGARPVLAFQLKVNMPEVRQEDRFHMIGVAQCLGQPVYPNLKALPASPPILVRKGSQIKTVDPSAETDSGKGVYRTLEAAILDSRPEDEIEIRSSAPLKIGLISPKRTIRALTIKPAAGSHPILTLDDNSPEKRAALFRLHDSHLRFVDLEFHLKPNKAELDFLAVVEMIGNGKCTFERCVITLFEGERADRAADMRRSAVRLTDPGEAMKMTGPPPPRSVPEIRFQDCFVRGQGDLVAVVPSRPFDLDVANSAIALDGCFLNVDGTAKAPPPVSPIADYNQVIKLTNATIYITGHLLYLRAKEDGTGLVPTAVSKATNNLFVAAGDRPLVQIDGLDKLQMERLFSWGGSTRNAYLNFETMLKAKATFEANAWPSFTKENDPDPAFLKLNGDKLDPMFSQLVPADLGKIKVADSKIELKKFGADLDKLPRMALREMKEDPEKNDIGE